MSGLAWKLNRLRSMGAAELGWRVSQVLQRAGESRLGLGLVRTPPAPVAAPAGLALIHPAALHDDADAAAVLAAAELIEAGRWQVFALHEAPLGFPPEWNRCPKTGTRAPLTFGTAIDYRREDLVGDIKYLWEPSRHLELVTLAMAFEYSGEQRHALAARALVDSWLTQSPYPLGVHWASSLELAIRLLNWSVAWPLLDVPGSGVFDGAEGAAFRRRWLDAVYQHCHFLCTHLSRHSSANNHLFGELMGLFVGALQWPCWRQSADWLALARTGLEREALVQVAADGVNLEQAVYYHHEVMDMMLLCDRYAAAAGSHFSPAFEQRLERMAEFIAALMDCGGHIPMIGDADDASMLRLDALDQTSPYHSLLASCALRFGRADFKRKAGRLDTKTRLLWGARAEPLWTALDAEALGPERPTMAFPEGGYYLLGSDFGEPGEVRAVIDCAPLGFLSIAAHGHADALAMTLSLGGHELLIDPGTYAYHTQLRWRNYFRGTAAHNTVEVDGLDQSVIGGNFMWLDKASSQLLVHEPAADPQRFKGQHDGYRRLPDAVTHRREIIYRAESAEFEVLDSFDCAAAHELALHWHFAENCDVTVEGGRLQARVADWRAEFECDTEAFSLQLFRGSDEPIAGWISRCFDAKTPTATACWRGRLSGPGTIRTIIRLHRQPPDRHQ